MKIWHLCSNRWNSAICEYALSSMKSLSLLGAEQLLSCLNDSPLEQRTLKECDIKIRPVKDFGFSNFQSLVQSLRDFNPDLVVAHGGQESFFLRLFKPKEIPAWRVFADANRFDKGAIGFWTGLNLRGFERVITPSMVLCDALKNKAKLTRVYPLAIGLDANKFYFDSEAFAHRSERARLMVFGRFDPVKGHELAFEAFSILKKQGFESLPVLKILGQEANLGVGAIRSYANAHGLNEGFDFEIDVSRVANLSAIMSSVDLALIPSLASEQICRVTQEFLLCGTPVLVSSAGALKECLAFEGAGYDFDLSEKNPAEACAKKIQKLMNEKMLKENQTTKRSRSNCAKHYFSLEAMAENFKPHLDAIGLR